MRTNNKGFIDSLPENELSQEEKDMFNEIKEPEIDRFFVRIHGHAPDAKCSNIDKCAYMDDGIPINFANDHEQDLMEYPEYPAKKLELQIRVAEFNKNAV